MVAGDKGFAGSSNEFIVNWDAHDFVALSGSGALTAPLRPAPRCDKVACGRVRGAGFGRRHQDYLRGLLPHCQFAHLQQLRVRGRLLLRRGNRVKERRHRPFTGAPPSLIESSWVMLRQPGIEISLQLVVAGFSLQLPEFSRLTTSTEKASGRSAFFSKPPRCFFNSSGICRSMNGGSRRWKLE